MDTRSRMFFCACIPTRLGFALIARITPPRFLPVLGYLALAPTVGFLGQYTLGLRETGKGFAGGDIWWAQLRAVHGVMYLLFSLYAIKKKSFAWIILLIDAMIGMVAGLVHYSYICL